MIIDDLKQFDPKRAAGILSRAALAIESGGINPASYPLEPHEAELRYKLVDKLSARVRKAHGEVSAEDLVEKMLETLDQEASALVPPVNEGAAIDRLAREGFLPSDVYSVAFDSKFTTEMLPLLPRDDRDLVRDAIRHPDLQEDFGPTITPDKPAPISLFGRWHDFGRARDKFLLVAAGERTSKKSLLVKHFWRVYPSEVNFRLARDLADVFASFAEVYGWQFQIATWRGVFLRYHKFLSPDGIALTVRHDDRKKPGKKFASAFIDHSGTYAEVSFAIGIDTHPYANDVSRHIKFETGGRSFDQVKRGVGRFRS